MKSDNATKVLPTSEADQLTRGDTPHMNEELQIVETPNAQASDSKRATAAARVRRCLERKRTGRLLATAEIDEVVLTMLSAGTKVDVDVLRQDRAQLNQAVGRALRHYGRRFAKTKTI